MRLLGDCGDIMNSEQLKNKILELTKEYYSKEFSNREFIPGETYVNYAGRIFDEEELVKLLLLLL